MCDGNLEHPDDSFKLAWSKPDLNLSEMKGHLSVVAALLVVSLFSCTNTSKITDSRYVDMVDPFLGTATLWDSVDLGYKPTRRAWGAEVYPGSSLPNAMVQVSPVTLFGSGAGYQYEDTVIYAFTHTNKGHWNLLHVPILPFTGDLDPEDYSSPYSHSNESARPGYYRVYLERYGVNAEMTSTLRCAFHRFTFDGANPKRLLADLSRSNERVRGWNIEKTGDHIFTGYQQTGETIYFYAVANHPVESIETAQGPKEGMNVVGFGEGSEPLELKIGFSFTSVDNAKKNLEAEMLEKSFDRVALDALDIWEELLSKIRVEGGTDKERMLFYSSLYRSFLWPALRSDANGDFTDVNGDIVNEGFRYYTDPSFWDDYRNKLVLLAIISPEVTADVINSLIDKGEKRGFMPTFFHGDHASVFVTGTYLRGIRGYDIDRAYRLILHNATVPNRARPWLDEYVAKGYVAEQDLENPVLETVAKAAVTKTLEYAYDDYAVAILAEALGYEADYDMLMARTGNYKNVFDPSTGFMRGRLEDGSWIEKFDPGRPFYEYMYREANAWQSTFFAPHDPYGLVALYPSQDDFEIKMDSLFTVPWEGYEAHNLTGFLGQYCHGNQPDHNFPHMYYFIDRPDKAQQVIDTCMERFYGMGDQGLALCGMDDAGEMSTWYVLSAIGLYTFSPADPEYLVTVPVFDRIEFEMGSGEKFTIVKRGNGRTFKEIRYGGKPLDGCFISHEDLRKGLELEIVTE